MKNQINQEPARNIVGLTANVDIFLTKDGEALIHKLPGNAGVISLHPNLYLALFNQEFTPKPKQDLTNLPRRYGFSCQPRVFISKSGEYLIHQVPGYSISKHVNFYKKLLGIDFVPKSQTSTQEKKKAQA